ncbi:MAG: hypothetical protein ACI9AT_001694 [Ulvibacter sp.]|jgi:hypothetical protein
MLSGRSDLSGEILNLPFANVWIPHFTYQEINGRIMREKSIKQIFSTPASLWDGKHQLSGILELWETNVIFRLTDFQDSHLHLCIPLNTIEKIEEFLIFDLAKNGLRIQDKNEKYDLFVLDEGSDLKKMILAKIKSMSF